MKYMLTVLALGSWPFVEISAEEFAQAKDAKERLVTFIGIEEKLDILLENYAEYERHLLDLTLRRVLFRDLLWSSAMTDLQHLTRRLANFLSAARLYVDQSKHDLSSIYTSGSGQQEVLKQALSREYDGRFGYRVMEALRNYMQHRSLPIKKLGYPSIWEEVGSERMLRCSAEIYLDVVELREDKKFKSNVLGELCGRARSRTTRASSARPASQRNQARSCPPQSSRRGSSAALIKAPLGAAEFGPASNHPSLRSWAKATAIDRNCTGYPTSCSADPRREASSRNLFTRASIGSSFRGARMLRQAYRLQNGARARSYE
jgi:hypothetical protein